jgi:hypothetical protein
MKLLNDVDGNFNGHVRFTSEDIRSIVPALDNIVHFSHEFQDTFVAELSILLAQFEAAKELMEERDGVL